MLRHTTHGLRWLVLSGLVLGGVLLLGDHASAFGFGPHRPFFPRARIYTDRRAGVYRPLYRPYYRYRPYFLYYDADDYYDYYGAYPSYPSYTPGTYQAFPAFRLPGFFQYPGAFGKGEDEAQALQVDTPPDTAGETGYRTVPSETPGR